MPDSPKKVATHKLYPTPIAAKSIVLYCPVNVTATKLPAMIENCVAITGAATSRKCLIIETKDILPPKTDSLILYNGDNILFYHYLYYLSIYSRGYCRLKRCDV